MLITHTQPRPDLNDANIPSEVNKSRDISDFQKRAALIELLVAFGESNREATRTVLSMPTAEVESKCAYYGPVMVAQAYASYEAKHFGGATC